MDNMTDTVKQLIIINALFFIGTLVIGETISYDYLALQYIDNPKFGYWQFVSYMFMHGGWMHIIFNMYGLFAFGSALEQMWGSQKFLFFYLSCGVGAALVHFGVNYYHFQEGMDWLVQNNISPEEVNSLLREGRYNSMHEQIINQPVINKMMESYAVPAVGASGAIYGVLVAFAFMFPNAELMMLFIPFPIKAKYFVPALIGMDLFSGFTGITIFGGNIAHFAHVGGALVGFLIMWYWKKNQFNSSRWN